MLIVWHFTDYTRCRGIYGNPFMRVTRGFIMTFGITPPRPEQELMATIFICTMLLGTVLFVLALGVFVLSRMF
jgi:hypothetical protein